MCGTGGSPADPAEIVAAEATAVGSAAASSAPAAPQGGSLPFVFSPAQRVKAESRLQDMFATGILPPALAYSSVKHWMSHPSWLKSHDWQLMSGMVGCYQLLGLLGQEQQAAISSFLMLLADLTARSHERADLPHLRNRAVATIVELERVLPACESGILRHMIIHLAEHAQTAGPGWVHAMWPWERMWGRLVTWLHQYKNPAASIMFTYHAYAVARQRCVIPISALTITDPRCNSCMLSCICAIMAGCKLSLVIIICQYIAGCICMDELVAYCLQRFKQGLRYCVHPF